MDNNNEQQFIPNQNDGLPEPDQTLDDYRVPVQHHRDVTTRVVVSIIALFGLTSIGMGLWLLQSRLSSPFLIDIDGVGAGTQFSSDTQLEDELRGKDTDGDSLNDYEEVYVFNTSPYLADTDSDGLNDGQEVSQGTNPNCKEGEECTGIRIVSPEAKLSDLFPQFSPTDASLKDATLKEFRQILIDSGMDPEVVASFTDDFLLVVIEVVVESESDDIDISVEDLSDREMRDFLIELGLQADEVNRIPPEEIREIIKTLL